MFKCFSHHYKDVTVETTESSERNLRRILGAKNALLDSEEKKREDNFFKDVTYLFRIKKAINNNAFKDTRNLFRLKKENKAIKDRR